MWHLCYYLCYSHYDQPYKCSCWRIILPRSPSVSLPQAIRECAMCTDAICASNAPVDFEPLDKKVTGHILVKSWTVPFLQRQPCTLYKLTCTSQHTLPSEICMFYVLTQTQNESYILNRMFDFRSVLTVFFSWRDLQHKINIEYVSNFFCFSETWCTESMLHARHMYEREADVSHQQITKFINVAVKFRVKFEKARNINFQRYT